MIEVGFSVEGTKELVSRLKRFAVHSPGAVSRAMKAEAHAIMNESLAELPEGATGELRRSWYVRAQSPLWIELGYDAEYAGYLHEGYGPPVGQPSHGDPGSKKSGFPSTRFKPWAAYKLGDERMAYPVARKKAIVGQVPLKFLERPLKRALPGMAQRIAIRVGLETGGI